MPTESELQDQLQAAEQWLARVCRVKRLRRLIQEEYPEEYRPDERAWGDRDDDVIRASIGAAKRLWFMAYVGRSDITSEDPAEMIFQYGPPHIRMAVDMWMAENKAFFYYGKLHSYRRPVKYEDVNYNIEYRKARAASNYKGVLFILPPRHGKTAFLRHWYAMHFNAQPQLQTAYVHSRDAEASKFVAYVAALYRTDNSAGRRNLSFTPGLRLSAKDNNRSRMRIHCDEPPSNPTLLASGIGAGAQGNNLDKFIADDVVSAKDQESETERELTKSRLSGTWMTRVQGRDGGFRVVAGYPWHQDDAVWDMLERAEEAERTSGRRGMRMRICKMAVGGPEENFRSIWPSMYDAHWLKDKYHEVGAATFAAQYQMRPLTDDMKIVKKVRLYDPKPLIDPEQHDRFVENCQIHMSVDPSFTNTTTSDEAGVVILGVGDVEDRTISENGATHIRRRTTIRVLGVTEMKSTQSEMTDHILQQASVMPIHALHVETTGGGGALVQMLEDAGVTDNVITHTTGNRNKEQRLRNVAMLLEDGAAGLRARVEFLGVRDEDTVNENGVRIPGELRVDPRMKRLIDYVENFKISSGHHSLDALTQAIKSIGEEYGFGQQASVTVQASRSLRFQGGEAQNRMRAHLKAQMAAHKMPSDRVMRPDEFRGFLGGGGI